MNVIEEETHVVETVHKTREDETYPLDAVSNAVDVLISSSPSIVQKTLQQDALSEWRKPIDDFFTQDYSRRYQEDAAKPYHHIPRVRKYAEDEFKNFFAVIVCLHPMNV